MTDHLIGFKPATMPTLNLAGANRQYAARIDAGEYGNTIDAVWQVKTGDILYGVGFACYAQTEGVSAALTIGAYVTNAAGLTEGALVTGTGQTINSSSAVQNYKEITGLNISLEAFVGQYIKPGGGSAGSGMRRLYVTCTSGDSVSVDNNLPNPFGASTARTNLMAMYLIIRSAQQVTVTATPTIGASTAITVSGFSGAVDRGSVDGVDLAAASNTSITIAPFVDGVASPRAGSGRNVTVGTATQSASAISAVNPPAGFSAVEIVSGFNTGEANSIAYAFSPALAIGDLIYFDPAKGTVDNHAGYEGDFTGSQILWHQQASAKIVRSFNLITGDQGEIISIGATGVVKIDDGSLSNLNAIATVNMSDLVSILLETEDAGSYFAINVNAPGGNGTFIAKLWVNGEIAPYPGDIIATAFDGTKYAAIDCQLQIPDNFLEQIFASPLATNTQYLPYWINLLGLGPAVSGEHVYWEFTGGNNVGADGLIEGAVAGTFPFYYHKANHYVFVLMVTMADDGIVTNVSLVGVDGSLLTQRGLTKRKLTERFLTSRKI